MTAFQVTVNTSNSRTDCRCTAMKYQSEVEKSTPARHMYFPNTLCSAHRTGNFKQRCPSACHESKGGNGGTNDFSVGQPAAHSLYRLNYRSSIPHWSMSSLILSIEG